MLPARHHFEVVLSDLIHILLFCQTYLFVLFLLYQLHFFCTLDVYSFGFIHVSLYLFVWFELDVPMDYLAALLLSILCNPPYSSFILSAPSLLYHFDVYFPCISFCTYVFSVEIMYSDVFYTDSVTHFAFHYLGRILVWLLVVVGDPMLLYFRLSVRTVGGFGHRMCVAGRILTPSGVGSSQLVSEHMVIPTITTYQYILYVVLSIPLNI